MLASHNVWALVPTFDLLASGAVMSISSSGETARMSSSLLINLRTFAGGSETPEVDEDSVAPEKP